MFRPLLPTHIGFAVFAVLFVPVCASAQDVTPSAVPAASTPPSLREQYSAPAAVATPGQLPREAGQEYREYDLSRYCQSIKKADHPQQAIVDWVLRETGTDVWFGKPFGFLSADAQRLKVYHTPSMQGIVKTMVDRFVNGPTDPQLIKLKLMTVSSPNWRSRALPLLQDVQVQSQGVQAWLMTKENAAVLASMLKARNDAKTIQDLRFPIYNGQSQRFEQLKGRNYVRTVRQTNNVWPPYEPRMGEVMEGYQLEVSPLLMSDGVELECMIRANIDQVDKLVPVELDLPLPNGQSQRMRIEVPQVVSWRLHERFRWDSKMVLLLSCGVVASPDRPSNALPILNLNRLVGNTPGRADALMFVEFGGRASEGLPEATPMVAGDVSRGRY